MVGMTTIANSSDYGSRYVVIDVAGIANQTISRVSNYQIKVPVSQMSATIRNISCQGGKVVKVAMQKSPSFEAVKHATSTVSQPAKTNKSTKAVKETKSMASKKKTPRKKTTTSRSSSRKSTRAKKK